MSRMANPFKPTAGKTPPAIIGRESVIDEFKEGIENGAGAPGRLVRISGVRGTGKTVLLNEVASVARGRGWRVIDEIATDGMCARILDILQSSERVSSAAIEPSVLGVSLGSVTVERVGPTLREAIAKAIKKNGKGLLFTLDEVQDAAMDEVRVLAVALQQTIRDDLDVAFVFAGLPSMIENVINGKTLTFLRRAVPFELKSVGETEVALSLRETFDKSGISLDADMSRTLASATHGYPFLIQLVGYHVWQQAHGAGASTVDAKAAESGIAIARERFDSSVIEPALQRVPAMGIAFLLAMASEGGSIVDSGAVAKRLNRTTQQLSSYRSQLIRDALVEAPSWGKLSFAIPYMVDYLNLHREELAGALPESAREVFEGKSE